MRTNEMVDAPGGWNELWGIVGESLLSGLHHALNNRVAALSAISQVLASGMPDASPLVAALAGEVNRLEDSVGLLSLLRRAGARRSEPVQLPEVVASLTPLLGHHNDLKETVFVTTPDPGVLPVWAERDLLTRVLLTLLVAVGLDAEWGGCRRVRITYRGDDDTVAIRIACEGEGSGEAGTERPIHRLDAGAAASTVRAMGGELEATQNAPGEVAYELRLPTLPAARKAAAAV